MNRRGFLKAMGAIAAGVGLRAVPVVGQQFSELVVPQSFAAAAPVAPVSALEYVYQTATVKTLAHWIPATLREVDDATAIRGLINSRLLLALDLALEDDILHGDRRKAHIITDRVEYVRVSELVA